MSKKDYLEVEGHIKKVFGNNNYLVTIEEGEKAFDLPCHLSGKMRQFKISVVAADRVKVEIDPLHREKGRITFAFRDKR